jgi:hypothetical protein
MESHVEGHHVAGHEENTVELKPIIIFAVVMVVVTIFSFAAMGFLLDFLRLNQQKTDVPLSSLANPNQMPPAPRLQVSPAQDLKQMRQTVDAVVNSYHWIDKDAGIVSIPIDRAIQILAEKGLPARDQSAQ